MPYGLLFKRSFEVIRRDPALLVLGFILALLGGTSGTNFNFPTGGGGGGDGSGEFPMPGDPGAVGTVDPGVVIAVVLAVVCLLFFLILLFTFLQAVAQAGLVYGVDQVDEGTDVHWRDLWRVGWSGAGRRLFGLRLLLALLVVVPVLVVVALGALFLIPVFAGTVPTGQPGVLSGMGILGFLAVLFPVILIFSALWWVIGLVVQFAIREIVLGRQGIVDSLKAGWRLFRDNIVPTIITSIVLLVLGFLWVIPTLLVVFIVGAIVALVVGGLVIGVGFSPWMIVPIILAALVVWVLVAAVSSPILTYTETVWTLLWRHLRGDRILTEETGLAPA